jgi:hypothetical protein
MKTAQDWIRTLSLQPHPEGGYFRETYRSAHSTAIYFLLEGHQFSAMHRIKSDEAWHFYAGSPLTVFVIHPDGRREDLVLGKDAFQAVVPGGCWQGAALRSLGEGGFALVGCTVAPAFEFKDFEMGNRAKLVSQYPQHREIISDLTTDASASAGATA